MNKFILLGMFAIVFISACTGGQQVTVVPTEGVIIKSFEAVPSNVLTGDSVIFQLEVENVGGTTAENVVAELFGVEGQWRDSSGDVLDDTQADDLGRLRPAIEQRNIPGDFRLAQWQLITPVIPQGLSPDLSVRARVTYDYNTSGLLQITAVSEDEFQRQRILGTVPPAPVIINSFGPLQLDIPTASQFQYIVVDTTSGRDKFDYAFRIVFRNVGGGFPVTDEGGPFIGAGGRLSGTISLLGPGVEFSDCLGVTSGNEINLDNADILPRVRENNQADIACTISFDISEWGSRPTDTVTFVFNIFYTYYAENSVSVKITGR